MHQAKNLKSFSSGEVVQDTENNIRNVQFDQSAKIVTFERQISTQDLIHDFDFNQNSNYFISLQVNNDKKWHLQNLFREKDKIETTTLSNSESMYIIT